MIRRMDVWPNGKRTRLSTINSTLTLLPGKALDVRLPLPGVDPR